MKTTSNVAPAAKPAKRLNLFERYLTLWVALCMIIGVALGKTTPGIVQSLRTLEFGKGSQVNVPIAVLIWLMIIPMMMKVDFASILGVRAKAPGTARHPVCELAGEALFDGPDRLGIFPPRFRAWIRPR